jgi:hypothetical protein
MDFTGEKPLDYASDKTEVWVCLEELRRAGTNNPVIDYYRQNIRPHIQTQLGEYRQQIYSTQRVPQTYSPDIARIFAATLEAKS